MKFLFPLSKNVFSFALTLYVTQDVCLLTLGCFSLASASCSRGAESLLAFLLKMLSDRSRYSVSQSQPPMAQSGPPPTHTSPAPTLCPRITSPLVTHAESGGQQAVRQWLWHFCCISSQILLCTVHNTYSLSAAMVIERGGDMQQAVYTQNRHVVVKCAPTPPLFFFSMF